MELLFGFGLGEYVAMVFSGGPTEEFKGHDEKNDSNTGASKHALRGDVPRTSDETFTEISRVSYRTGRSSKHKNQLCTNSRASRAKSK